MSRQSNKKGKRTSVEMAQHFTPTPVATSIWTVARSFLGENGRMRLKVIDPAAGEGVFLKVVAADRETSVEQVCGIEIDAELTGSVSGGEKSWQLFAGDGLTQTFAGVQPGSFDVVIGNPPFGRVGNVLPQVYRSSSKKWAEQFTVWRIGGARGSARRDLRCFPIEVLFVERALQLARPDGLIAFIMPEGFLANDRLQKVRDWVLERAELLAAIGLPEQVFRRSNLHAKTAAVFLRKKGSTKKRRRPALMVEDGGEDTLVHMMDELQRDVRAAQRGRTGDRCMRVAAAELPGRRWDAQFWRGRQAVAGLDRRFALVQLGDYIEHLTYGPIVTGRKPHHVEAGIALIRQGDFAETGLCLEGGLRVAEGSVYDPQRSRVQEGDLLLPRSGAGALGRNRMAVYLKSEPANIGCFVDRIRLVGLNPFYVWFFFKTEFGWGQIRALINGVGTPNINFSEVRSLRLPLIPEALQRLLEERYRREVWPLHRRRAEDEAIRRQGEVCFRQIVDDLKSVVCGGSRVLS